MTMRRNIGKRKKRSYARKSRSYANPFFKKVEKFPLRLVVDSIVLVAVVAAFFWLIVWSPFFRVQDIEIFGMTLSTEEELTQAVEKYLSITPGLIPHDALFFITENALEEYLEKLFPIDTVVVTKQLPSTLYIALKEIEPAAKVAVEDKISYITATGEVFFLPTREYPELDDHIPYIILGLRPTTTLAIRESSTATSTEEQRDENVYATATPAYRIEQEKVMLPKNTSYQEQVIEQTVVAQITALHALLRHTTIEPKVYHVLLPYFQDFTLATKEGWQVRFSLTDDSAAQVERLVVLLQGELKNKRSLIKTIDARFGSRIFYETK